MYVSCSGLVMVQSDYPTVEDALAKMQELGFAALDLDIFENWQHVNPSVLAASEGEVQSLIRTVVASGMKVSSFNCSPSKSLLDPDPNSLAQYKREIAVLLDMAEKLDCPNITLQPGGNREGRSGAEVLGTLKANLTVVGRLAEGRNVTVSIENHANTVVEKPEVALVLIKELWPAVGITYDPSHMTLQDIPLPDSECLLDYTVHAHARNASSAKMQDTMQDGTVDFEWLIPALKAHGYDGGISIEYFNGFDADFTSTRALKERLVQLGVDAEPGISES